MLNNNYPKKRTLKRAGKHYVYNKKEYRNPFFKKSRTKKNFSTKCSRRIKLIATEIVVLLFGLSWFFFFSPVFEITEINIIGNERIQQKDIQDIISKQMSSHLNIQKNIFLFNRQTLIDDLKDKYCLEKIIIKKDFPSTIITSIVETKNSAIWHENDIYYYIDSDGNIIEEVEPLEITQKNFPLIDNQSSSYIIEKNINEQDKNQLKFIIELFETLNKNNYPFKIEKFLLDDELNTVKVMIIQGPIIKFNPQEQLEGQINKFNILINQTLKDDYIKLKKIDLRYGELIFYE